MTPSQPEIRFATLEDFDAVYKMVEEFFLHSPYAVVVELDREFLQKQTLHFLTNGVVVVHEGPKGLDGMLIAIISTAIFADIPMAMEAAWWVNEDVRGTGISTKLLDGFEYWAELKGCAAVTMSSLNTRNVDEILTNRGYTILEVAYGKVL